MALSFRHKITIILLAFYWPTLFIFAHIPIPNYIRRAGVSDKCLHFLAYLVLTYLLWFTIRADEKANWRRAITWMVFMGLTAYGAIDEVVQSFVGRTYDVTDIIANMTGTFTGLFLFTFLTFWSATLFVVGIVIFGVTNLLRANLAVLLPATNAIFHFFAYAFFTALWIQNMRLLMHIKPPEKKWLVYASTIPTGLLVTVKIFSAIQGRYFTTIDIIISVGAIIAVVAAVYLWSLIHKTSDSLTKDI